MKSRSGKLLTICLVLTAALNSLVSCVSPPESAPPSAIQVTDQLSRAVKLEAIPQRIISLAPSNTEILFALDLADQVMAVTDYCDYPPEAETKPSIGGFSTPNIEEIIALSPDLILATSIHEEQIIPQLEAKGLTVFGLDPTTLNEVLEAIVLVGRVTGAEETASKLVDRMNQRIKAVTDKTSALPPEQRTRTFYILWHDPLKTTGTGTLQDELIQKSGGINIARGVAEYANISLEVVVKENPEVIIAGAGHGSEENQIYQYARNESRLRSTAAHQSNRIFRIDSNLSSRPGPRIVDGLEQFAKFLHPEIFGSPENMTE